MISEHAILAPSSASRWVKCAGSVILSQAYPQDDNSEAALEGTCAHWGASEMLLGKTIDVGLIAPNGVMVNAEMLEAIDVYVDAIRMITDNTDSVLHVEERVDISVINEANWGTPDAWIYDKKTGILHVWDFKYGHMYVDEYENWQLIDYVAGIKDALGFDGIQDQHVTVHMTVVQPRCFSASGMVRTWKVSLCDLRGHFNALRMAAERALKPNADCIVNTGCTFCSARHVCKALQLASMDAVAISATSAPVELSPSALGLELAIIERALVFLKARQTGLSEQALSTFKAGKSVARYRVEPTEGRLQWNKPLKEVISMGDLMNVKVSKDSAITPRQAIKLGLPEDLVLEYSGRESGGMKLVADNGTKASKIFNNL